MPGYNAATCYRPADAGETYRPADAGEPYPQTFFDFPVDSASLTAG